jgi:phage-related minor tail protein
MVRRSGIAGAWRTGGLDHLKVLCACLADTASQVRSLDGQGADEGTRALQAAYALDARAFEMAVEAALFFEAAGEDVRVWNEEMRRLAGLALAATAGLHRSIEDVVRQLGASGKESCSLFPALHSLSAVVGRLKERLDALCRSLIITELCSAALVSRVRPGQGAEEGGDRTMSPSCQHVPSFGIRRDL